MCVWRPSDGSILKKLDCGAVNGCSAVAFSPNGKMIAAAVQVRERRGEERRAEKRERRRGGGEEGERGRRGEGERGRRGEGSRLKKYRIKQNLDDMG